MSLAVIETNEIHLIGRLAKSPTPKTTPNGVAAVGFRLVIRRPPAAVRRQSSDFIECVCDRPATIKAAAGWSPGDVLEVNGSLHRHFWRVGSETRNAYEVEVRTVRRVARGTAAKPKRGSVTTGAA